MSTFKEPRLFQVCAHITFRLPSYIVNTYKDGTRPATFLLSTGEHKTAGLWRFDAEVEREGLETCRGGHDPTRFNKRGPFK